MKTKAILFGEDAADEQSPKSVQVMHPNSVIAQRARLLSRLHHSPITSIQARSELDILHPAARVLELRNSGYNIVTHWCSDKTPDGGRHRVAEYVLLNPIL